MVMGGYTEIGILSYYKLAVNFFLGRRSIFCISILVL